jgi:hypothetical protein
LRALARQPIGHGLRGAAQQTPAQVRQELPHDQLGEELHLVQLDLVHAHAPSGG